MFGRKQESDVRDRVIAYKNTFGSEMGKKVLFDLMNRYHILNDHGGDMHAEGQRAVVLHILKQCNINIEELDKLLKGELE
jgi:hypothetical protein